MLRDVRRGRMALKRRASLCATSLTHVHSKGIHTRALDSRRAMRSFKAGTKG
jgi:hypothetical protein